MKKALYFFILFLYVPVLHAQNAGYSVANAHSHNDYEQLHPFWAAYKAGFGSIEADIFLLDGRLYVAHDTIELRKHILLEMEYLDPLRKCLSNNTGYPFKDHTKKLQMLIDIKTDSLQTLDELIRILKKYPTLIENKLLTWVITGNRPPVSDLTKYPSYILFDGNFQLTYTDDDLNKVALFSDNFKSYSQWSGSGELPLNDSAALQSAIQFGHRHHKPVRFWNAPDTPTAWNKLIHLGADIINTDDIKGLAEFLRTKRSFE